jgi:hypothetical protein
MKPLAAIFMGFMCGVRSSVALLYGLLAFWLIAVKFWQEFTSAGKDSIVETRGGSYRVLWSNASPHLIHWRSTDARRAIASRHGTSRRELDE